MQSKSSSQETIRILNQETICRPELIDAVQDMNRILEKRSNRRSHLNFLENNLKDILSR